MLAETIRAALTQAAGLFAPVSATARLDAELLMAHALGVSRQDVLMRHLGEAVPEGFGALVARRLVHEPVAYITGSRDFWTITLAVGPGVLIPRADSETLIEAALEYFGAKGPQRVLDLGTGPGTLLLAALAEWPEATGLGVDASAVALDYAARNAAALGMAARAVFRAGDWHHGIEERFDLILANPPYIGTGEPLMAEVAAHEPASALFAGADGLDDYRRIVPALPGLLRQGGAAVIEIGYTQAVAVTQMVRAAGLSATIRHDLGGHARAIIAS